MLQRLRTFTVAPRQYAYVAYAALGTLTLIVFTGSAVRLTGSGLGCPTWPRCYKDGQLYAQLNTHAVIEFGNRLLTSVVGAAAVAAAVLVWRIRPRREDLRLLGMIPLLGVFAQIVLGGITVRLKLAPGPVMAHFVLSMIVLVGAVALVWRLHHPEGDRPRTRDRLAVWGTRALAAFGGIVIVAGTVATAAGPHAGGDGTGDIVNRLHFRGSGTLDFAIHQHGALAAVLGVAAVALWLLLQRRGADADVLRPVFYACLLVAAQGAVGTIQYALELPAEIVWVHVAVATLTWLTLVWSAIAAGRLAPAPAANSAAAERRAAPA
jgi:cytochrome c oxidase assembly protein subunit 15